jgi:hypothetical protein
MIAARRELDSLLDQIERSSMTLPGVVGEWSVKDILAHLASYDRELGLTLALHGQKPIGLWIEDLPTDEFNDRLYEEHRDKPLDDVLGDYRLVWQEILDAVRDLPEEYLFNEHTVVGVPEPFRPCDVLQSESYGHYLDHVPALKAWVDAGHDLKHSA